MSTFNVIAQTNRPSVNNNANQAVPTHKQLRWDRANLESYNKLSGDLLAPLLEKVNFFVANSSQLSLLDSNLIIDQLFTETCNALVGCADEFVPHCRKKNFKFWWNEELELLKEASIESNRIWKAAGKPRNGPLFEKRQSCRLKYRKRIREDQNKATTVYSNELHDALLCKDGSIFWKVWR
jgi:hypothetical protein